MFRWGTCVVEAPASLNGRAIEWVGGATSALMAALGRELWEQMVL